MRRTLFSVYRKATRMYDRRNYVGRYSADEEKRLLQLHERIGSNWIEIGFAMGRSPASVKDKMRMLKTVDANKGTPTQYFSIYRHHSEKMESSY